LRSIPNQCYKKYPEQVQFSAIEPRERQLPPTPLTEGGAGRSALTEGGAGGSALTEGGEGGSSITEGGAGGSSITEGGRGEKAPQRGTCSHRKN